IASKLPFDVQRGALHIALAKMSVEERQGWQRRLSASFSEYVLNGSHRDLANGIIHIEISEFSERNVGADGVKEVHLKDVVEDPIATADRHLRVWYVVIESHAGSKIVQITIYRRTADTVLRGDQEASSRIEVGNPVVLVVGIAGEFVAHSQGQAQIRCYAPGVGDIPVKQVAE